MPDGGMSPFAARVIPAAIEAEQALLGAVMNNNKALDRIDFLAAEHFYEPRHGRIWARILQRVQNGQVADVFTLKVDFENTGVLEEIGGTEYLVQLSAAMVAINIAVDYARAVHQTWLRRQVIEASAEMMDRAYGAEPGENPQSIVDQAAETVLSLGRHGAANRGTTLGAAAAAAIALADATQSGKAGMGRLETGITPVDALWGGLYPGELYFLMARSRTGKTPFMMQIARNIAGQLAAEAARENRQPEHVHVFSLEMTADNLGTTNLAALTRYSADQIKAGAIPISADPNKGWGEIRAAQAQLDKLPIWVDDDATIDLPGLAMRARAIQRLKRTRLICIDYRELIQRGRDQARMGLPEWIPYLGNSLKALSKALNVPIIALTQINKARDKADDTRPTLNDLPYDGGQAADAVVALHRPELYMPEAPPVTAGRMTDEMRANAAAQYERERAKKLGITEFFALKRRFGPTGMCELRFNGPRMTVSPIEKTPDQSSLGLPPPGRFED